MSFSPRDPLLCRAAPRSLRRSGSAAPPSASACSSRRTPPPPPCHPRHRHPLTTHTQIDAYTYINHSLVPNYLWAKHTEMRSHGSGLQFSLQPLAPGGQVRGAHEQQRVESTRSSHRCVEGSQSIRCDNEDAGLLPAQFIQLTITA